MNLKLASASLTLRGTFSFYVSGSDAQRIRTCAEGADAIVAAGASGPMTVRQLRNEGWTRTVLFDRVGYRDSNTNIDLPRWMADQERAGADRLLTPGRWVGAEGGHATLTSQIEAEVKIAEEYVATCLLALDYRWLTKSSHHDELLMVFQELHTPVAIVLGDRSDPLGHPGAVDALIALTKRINGISLLRTDHGAVGALAFDAAHASIGLTTTHRHVVPPTVQAHGIPNDRSARVFVKDLMDWFTASTIGGWSTTRITPVCNYACCDGQRIERFLDDRLKSDADRHNRTVLAAIVDEILGDPESTDRRRAFGRMCYDAVERYGIMGGLTTEITPKAQLCQWAQYY
jgi:hypothetical protein